MSIQSLQQPIEALWERRDTLSSATKGADRDAVEAALEAMDNGSARVAEKTGGDWVVNQWLKKAVLLSFRLYDSAPMDYSAAGAPAYDKVPLKTAGWGENRFKEAGFRAVPGAVIRRSAYIAPGAVLMPSFVNLGARVGANTMVGSLYLAALRAGATHANTTVNGLGERAGNAAENRCHNLKDLGIIVKSPLHANQDSREEYHHRGQQVQNRLDVFVVRARRWHQTSPHCATLTSMASCSASVNTGRSFNSSASRKDPGD